MFPSLSLRGGLVAFPEGLVTFPDAYIHITKYVNSDTTFNLSTFMTSAWLFVRMHALIWLTLFVRMHVLLWLTL
jgi:hypothetical protein